MALRPDPSVGYQAAAKLMVGFMFGFYFLRYTPFLSICLAAIAAVTGGFIAAWWNAKDDYVTDEAAAPVEEKSDRTASAIISNPIERRPVRYGFGVKSAREIRTSRTVKMFNWSFRRKR